MDDTIKGRAGGNMKKTIRLANEQDFNFIYDAVREDLNEQGVLHRFKYSQEEFREVIFGRLSVAKFLILSIDGQSIGFANYNIDHRNFTANYLSTLYLNDLYVVPSHRKIGGGTLLFNTLKDIAKREHCGCIEWLVLAKNKPSLDFYQKSLKGKIISDQLHYMRLEL